MTTIGLVVRPGVERATKLARELLTFCEKNKFEILCEDETAQILGQKKLAVSNDTLVAKADPIITLGGDGTLIGIARHIEGPSPVIIGVNFGNLGFLTEIAPEEMFEVLSSVLKGKAEIKTRRMLLVTVEREGEEIFRSQAINDAVVLKGAQEKLLGLDLSVGNEGVMRVRADGIIVATPTGSTAYSLAAGGSIAYPSLDVVLITPICPHSLTNRPLILPLDQQIKIVVPEYTGEVHLTVDGQISVALAKGDQVTIVRANHGVTYVRSPSRGYFEILRTKLNWGIPNNS